MGGSEERAWPGLAWPRPDRDPLFKARRPADRPTDRATPLPDGQQQKLHFYAHFRLSKAAGAAAPAPLSPLAEQSCARWVTTPYSPGHLNGQGRVRWPERDTVSAVRGGARE